MKKEKIKSIEIYDASCEQKATVYSDGTSKLNFWGRVKINGETRARFKVIEIHVKDYTVKYFAMALWDILEKRQREIDSIKEHLNRDC